MGSCESKDSLSSCSNIPSSSSCSDSTPLSNSPSIPSSSPQMLSDKVCSGELRKADNFSKQCKLSQACHATNSTGPKISIHCGRESMKIVQFLLHISSIIIRTPLQPIEPSKTISPHHQPKYPQAYFIIK